MSKIIMLSMLTLCLSVQGFAQESGELPPSESRMIIASGDGTAASPQVFYSYAMPADAMGTVVVGDRIGFGGKPDVFSLAQNRGVQKEIELVDEQIQQIREINKDFGKRMQERIAEITSGKMNAERSQQLRKLMREMHDEKKAKMESVLLPHQFDRLRQISLQTHKRRSGQAGLLGDSEVAEALGISDEQQERLKERAKELKEKLQADIKRLKKKSEEALLKELSRDQRKKLTELLGEEYEVKRPSYNRIRNAPAPPAKAEDSSK